MASDSVIGEQVKRISGGVAGILAAADAEIAGRGAVCRGSGRCCHFEEWGHRLYVTTAELVHFVHAHLAIAARQSKIGNQETGITSLAQFLAEKDPGGCPFQSGTLCTVRDSRPLGCRVYFCDRAAQAWQNDVYEKYHAQLRALHEQFKVPYRYLEWRAALRQWADAPSEGIIEALLARQT